MNVTIWSIWIIYNFYCGCQAPNACICSSNPATCCVFANSFCSSASIFCCSCCALTASVSNSFTASSTSSIQSISYNLLFVILFIPANSNPCAFNAFGSVGIVDHGLTLIFIPSAISSLLNSMYSSVESFPSIGNACSLL
jgi:hypothetical protein